MLTADEIEKHLHERDMPLLFESGGTCPGSLQGMQEGLKLFLKSRNPAARPTQQYIASFQ